MKHIRIFICLLTVLFSQDKDIHKLAERANQLLTEDKVQQAQELYQEALLSDGSNAVLWYNLGNTFFKQQQFAEARACYTKALELRETNELADVNYNIGNTYLYESKPDTAIQYYKRSLELNDKDTDAKHNMELARAIIKEKSKKEKQEQKQQQKQQEQKKVEPSDYAKREFAKAQEKLEKGMFQEALELMENAKKADPTVDAYQEFMKNLKDIVTVLES